MEEKIKLTILGLSYSQIQSGAYALILAQEDGAYRIPVVIGAAEAQSIAIKIEDVNPPRPLTHDLFVSFAHGFGITLQEVFIYKFEDGVFFSELTFSDGDRDIVIDSRTSDAIAIAIRTQAPIYTTKKIIHETGFLMDESDNKSSKKIHRGSTPSAPKIENYSVEELERSLSKLIAEEKYEEAAIVNNIIKQKKSIK